MRVSIERTLSNREVGICGADQLSQRLGERFRALARARDDENTGRRCDRRKADKPPPAPAFRELRLFYRADNADNGEEISLLSLFENLTTADLFR